MDQWHEKKLGFGAGVYQHLRDLRELRYQYDKGVTPDRAFVVAMNIETSEISVYFPPGNKVLVHLCDAASCPTPNFENGMTNVMSEEEFPIVPSFIDAISGV